MNVLIGANDVLLNLDRNQLAFEKTVQQLSSGLRINSAADDPSGNAIAVNLTSKYEGLQQSVQNVQNGVNALNVANGALVQVQNILVRINNLLVEANSDVNSTADKEDIQAEIEQLLTEINSIGEKTNFNGQNLLNGQFDTSEGTDPSWTQVNSPNGGTTDVVNASGNPNGGPGPLVNFGGAAPINPVNGEFAPSVMVITVTGYSDNAIDPDSQTDVGPGDYVQFQWYGNEAQAQLGGSPMYQFTAAIPVNTPGYVAGDAVTAPSGAAALVQNLYLANLTSADVGASMAFLFTEGTSPAGGTALQINDGGDEGDLLQISLPTVSTNALGLSNITVLDPTATEDNTTGSGGYTYNNPVASNVLSASYSQLLVQNALTTITTQEAQLGAQVVAMTEDESDDNTAIVNYQGSASNIADLNIGEATTSYTRQQILTSVGTDVLSQIQTQGKVLTGLLINALIA